MVRPKQALTTMWAPLKKFGASGPQWSTFPLARVPFGAPILSHTHVAITPQAVPWKLPGPRTGRRASIYRGPPSLRKKDPSPSFL